MASTASLWRSEVTMLPTASMKVDLPAPGTPRDTDAHRASGVGQAALDDLLRLRIVGRIRRLDERDGLRKGGDVAREDARDILVGGERALLAPREVRTYDRLVFNTFSDVERRVVVRVRILFFVVVYFRERHGFYRVDCWIVSSSNWSVLPIHNARLRRSVSTPKGT